MNKSLFTCLALLLCFSIYADRYEDTVRAINASNFEDVHYYLVLQGNTLSSETKDALHKLSQEILKKRAKKMYPFHNLKDSITTVYGFALLAATAACFRVVKSSYENIDIAAQTEISIATHIFWPLMKICVCGAIGLVTGLAGAVNTFHGLRCATARKKLADAQKIDERLKAVRV